MPGWEGLANIGPAGVQTIIVLAVAFGFLIPRWTFNRMVKSLENEKAEWRSIALKLMGVGEVTVKALEDIKKEAAKK